MMIPAPVPGEAWVTRAFRKLVLIINTTLGFGSGRARGALLDTSATYCAIPEPLAVSLNPQRYNRLGTERLQAASGPTFVGDRYHLEYVQADDARAHAVDCPVGDVLDQFMLLGMSFIERFQTTLDLDAQRGIFRLRPLKQAPAPSCRHKERDLREGVWSRLLAGSSPAGE